MKIKSIIAAAVLLPMISQAEIKQEYGVDQKVDYKSLMKQGMWDDRNYNIQAKDLTLLPADDQVLKNVPLFFKIEMRKNNPNLGKYYPRSAHQEFLMKYGGVLKDGEWKVEGLGLHYMKGIITENQTKNIPGIPEQIAEMPININAVSVSSETALATGVSGNEVTIECNPTNGNNCVAGSNQNGGQAMYYSSDAGETWTKSQTNSGSCCDPTIDWSSDGSIVYQGDLSGPNIGVRWSRSLDQGVTWESMKVITSSGSDKEFIHVDRSNSSPYKDNVYMTWHDGNVMQFARSTDMGVSFSNPISFNSEPRGIGSDITTDAAGNIYYFYPSTDGSGVRVIKSTNGGASFSSSSLVSNLNGDFDFPVPAMETREVFIYTSADVSKDNDDIYVAWTDEADDSAGNGTGSANNNRAVIKVAKSTNGGSSWSICPDPHSSSGSLSSGNPIDRFHPWIKVDENGVVHIAYYDTRHSSNRSGVDFYYNRSVNDCASWDTETRYSTQTSSNLNDGQEWGDYNGLSVVLDKKSVNTANSFVASTTAYRL
ncbi:MAG: sialidase family protein, partial [Marinicella sp.]